MKLAIDFETRSTVPLVTRGRQIGVGAWAYFQHSSTQVVCCAFKIDNGPAQIYIDPYFKKLTPHYPSAGPEELQNAVLNAAVIEAHNAEFERAGWINKMIPAGFPPIPLEKWRCSAAKAAALALPRSLGELARVLQARVQKDEGGRQVMLKLCKPRAARKNENPGFLYWHEKPEDFIKLFDYCKNDVETEYQISGLLPDLDCNEQQIWFLDQIINERGAHVDVESAGAIVHVLENYERALLAEMQELTGRMVASPRQTKATQDWLQGQGVNLPNIQKGTVAAVINDLSGPARRVLEIRQELSKSSTSKLKTILAAVCADGRIRDLFLYWAASTGRWGGRKLQPQNLPREGYKKTTEQAIHAFKTSPQSVPAFFDPYFFAAAKLIRAMVTAGPGKEFIAADYSSIEARVLAWLADEQYTLDAFRAGLDLYKVSAMDTYNVPYDQVTDAQRQVGKCQELGLGYQGGIGAYANIAKGYGLKSFMPLYESVIDRVDQEVIRKAEFIAKSYIARNPGVMTLQEAIGCDIVKQLWRAARPRIVEYWARIEGAAKRAIMTRQAVTVGRVTLGIWDNYLMIRLPSGRFLAYSRPNIVSKLTDFLDDDGRPVYKDTIQFWGVDSTSKKWCVQWTYGGSLVENIVQAVARDLLAWAMIRLHQAGYKIVLHIHDEIVSEVFEGTDDLELYCKIMSELPYWAEGCPVAAEGWRGKRFKK